MRWQPGRSPEEGATFSAADASRRRTLASGRCRGRRRWSGSLFAASAGSSALSPLPSSSPPSSSDGTCASESGGPAIAPAGVLRLSGLVALDPGYLRLKPTASRQDQRDFATRKKPCRVASFGPSRRIAKRLRVHVGTVPWDRRRVGVTLSSVYYRTTLAP